MIRSDNEYNATRKELEERQARLAEYEQKLQEEGLRPDQMKRLLDPLLSFQNGLREDLEIYDRAKAGHFRALKNLHGIEECLIGLRVGQALSQRDLAARIGVHETQVSRDERNDYAGITLDRARRILDALNADCETRISVSRFEFVPVPIRSTVAPAQDAGTYHGLTQAANDNLALAA